MDDQLQKIKALRPTLVIVDSITMIDEFEDGMNGRKVKEVVQKYRQAANDTNAHVIFIIHVTKKGESRGSTTLPHLVDSVFKMHREKGYEGFVIETKKHRYGKSGLKSYWKYEGPLPTGYPSEEMFQDRLWNRDHSMAMYPKPEEPFDAVAYVHSQEFSDFCGRVVNYDDPSQGCWLKRKATQLFVTLFAQR